jgi:hypothetical protein
VKNGLLSLAENIPHIGSCDEMTKGWFEAKLMLIDGLPADVRGMDGTPG